MEIPNPWYWDDLMIVRKNEDGSLSEPLVLPELYQDELAMLSKLTNILMKQFGIAKL